MVGNFLEVQWLGLALSISRGLGNSVCAVCLTLYEPMSCSLPDSDVCGIFQARIQEWVAISSLMGSF